MIVRSKAWLLALGFAFLAGPGGANPPAIAPKAVVELFTSQGCSSCPPADKLLAELAERSDLVALTLPVDYWDYLGWKDTLAHPLFSARQRGYAYVRGDRQVYTPQVVVNGSKPCLGSDRVQVEQSIADAGPQAPSRSLDRVRAGRDRHRRNRGGPDGRHRRAMDPAGDALAYGADRPRRERGPDGDVCQRGPRHDPAREWRGGSAQFEVPRPRGDGDGYVVLLQSRHGKKPGPIIGAAKSRGL